jgi:hypothetical protein
LEEDPRERLSWDEYFNHSFFKDYNNCITIKYKVEDLLKIIEIIVE